MGLTGVIIRAAIKLRLETSWIKQKTLVAKNIDQTFDFLKKYERDTQCGLIAQIPVMI